MLSIPPETLLALVRRWEPEASASLPTFRRATCVSCGQPMVAMWHVWLDDGGFKKEVHLCRMCGEPWES